ncbi:uncharacterized protein LOC111025011 isoform X2 [Momordica charantia]|uniref:Uncharacterized protein LOC111025011 isoform X2 n=1 Tax=Momordica charantia TaxID=3673 RepID=A0A6J1DW60_MOMCH|nr:uncharacterized protein LOC111025011 isoform X2 [Momordica charantia]
MLETFGQPFKNYLEFIHKQRNTSFARLDEEYNPVIAMIKGRAGISSSEIQVELLVFEKRLEFQNSQKNTVAFNHTPTLNMANSKYPNRGQRQHLNNNQNNNQRSSGSRYRGRGKWNNNDVNRQICQVCGKSGHSIFVCGIDLIKNLQDLVRIRLRVMVPTHIMHLYKMVVTLKVQLLKPLLQYKTLIRLLQIWRQWLIQAGTVDSGASNHVTADYNDIINPVEYGGYMYRQCGAKGGL